MNSTIGSTVPLAMFYYKCGIPHDIDFVRPELKLLYDIAKFCANKSPRTMFLSHRNLQTTIRSHCIFRVTDFKRKGGSSFIKFYCFFLTLSFLSNFPQKWMALLSNFPNWLSVHFKKRNLNGKNWNFTSKIWPKFAWFVA